MGAKRTERSSRLRSKCGDAVLVAFGWEELCLPSSPRLSPSSDESAGHRPPSPLGRASCSPRCFSTEALVAGDLPRWHRRSAPQLLPRRIHLPVKPTNVLSSRAALLSPRSAGRPNGCRALRSDPEPQHEVARRVNWIPTSAETVAESDTSAGPGPEDLLPVRVRRPAPTLRLAPPPLFL